MRFENTAYLFGLIGVPLLIVLFFLVLRWKKNRVRKIGDPKLVKLLTRSYSPFLFATKFIITLLAFVAVVIGAANLQKAGKTENVNLQGVDIMMVLDVSKSMLAQDIQPSRLEKSKQLLERLMDKLTNDRVGLVLFAGRAYMQMPLTTDHSAAKMYIQQASPDVVPTQGTVIADALRMANTSFNSKEKKYKAIVLISDGEDHDPDAAKVAKELAESGVMINAVGVGSPDGSTIIDPITKETKKDAEGQTVISKLNEAALTQLTNISNGIYLRLDNLDDALITLSQRLDGIEKRALTDSEYVNYNSYFQWFLAVALLFIIGEFLLPERKSVIA